MDANRTSKDKEQEKEKTKGKEKEKERPLTGQKDKKNEISKHKVNIPQISLPKGGGALKGIDEKFQVNAANGTGSLSIPLALSKSRTEFAPSLVLNYNSGAGNSTAGLGWSLDVSSIQRKTDKKLPRYQDDLESDVFMISGSEDLVPVLKEDPPGIWSKDEFVTPANETVTRYRPRIEGTFARIEKIRKAGDKTFYWKVTSKDNTVTYYGITSNGRITDPENEFRVYRWFPELSFDNKGNCIEYEYVSENLVNVPNVVSEGNRHNGVSKYANTYLKRIKYGNKNPYYPDAAHLFVPKLPVNPDYFFETVIDYGDHLNPTDVPSPPLNQTCLPGIQQEWDCRPDPFSDYHPGFEIRTYRMCRRILQFHYFKELNDGVNPAPYLVKSWDLKHKYFRSIPSSDPFIETDLLLAVQEFCYQKNASGYYDRKGWPAMEFTYQELKWNKQVQQVAPEEVENAPVGIGNNYQWIDLWGEGISGILSEQAQGWFYKYNEGDGKFTPAQLVASRPSLTGLADGSLQVQDVTADGKKYVVSTRKPMQGFFELTDENEWLPFRSFDKMPTEDLRDQNSKFIDLNGDGMPELIVSEENVFRWYPSLGKQGYDTAELAAKSTDEEKGPAIVFADELQTIFVADMNGDGMADIVRIRNGEACYWPNLGYGRFGSKINMANAPLFDTQDHFNSSYIQLADVSGTGASDLIYLGQNKFSAYINLSGNAWSAPQEIDPFPSTEHPNQISVIDFLGNGTGCLVWSSSLPANALAPMRYIDLMGGVKPYVMSGYKNNFGKEILLEYKSSTYFFLKDRKEGKPWATKLPFPVQCISKVQTRDIVTNVYFVNEYSYHHGYYDHEEREFRGFGRVEQKDTQDFDNFVRNNASNIVDQVLYQPPVLTKTWFHTGFFFNQEKIMNKLADEYFKNSFFSEYHLPASSLPEGMTSQEYREALRACKSVELRKETYGLDDSPESIYPYTVVESNLDIRMLQPVKENKYAVFRVHQSEVIQYHYERDPHDPRIEHSFNLKVDEYGNVLKSASVVYGRQGTEASLPAGIDPAVIAEINNEQKKLHVTLNENDYTQDISTPSDYLLRRMYESRNYELTGKAPSAVYFTLKELRMAADNAVEVEYTAQTDALSLKKRLLDKSRMLFMKEDLSGPLPLNQLSKLGIIYESYQLCFTQSLLNEVYAAKVDNTMLTEGEYLLSDDYKASGLFPSTDASSEWWIRSGLAIYPPQPEQHFYMPVEYRDPYNISTKVTYYSDYHLFVNETEDALSNKNTVEEYNFRIMAPQLMRDLNDNYSEVRFDLLGSVVGSALRGKGTEADDFIGFKSDLTDGEIAAFFSDPVANGANFLQHAGGRFVYDYSSLPVRAGHVVRETHYQDTLDPGTALPLFQSKLQYSFEYSDGSGNVVMRKVQAEPGEAKKVLTHPGGTVEVITVDTTPQLRWVGTGRTVWNNKGKPVKKYEPYFSVTHLYEDAKELVEIGVSPVLYYDPVDRLIRTEFPDGSLTRVKFNNWSRRAYDQNDTVLDPACKWFQDRTTGPLAANVWENDAAVKAAVHADTPLINVFDSLGRSFYTIPHNRYRDKTGTVVEEFYPHKTEYDIEGSETALFDALGNKVVSYKYDMLSNRVYEKSMDQGEHWILNDCIGKAEYGWDSTGNRFHTQYDNLHRPIAAIVRFPDNSEVVYDKSLYGEGQPGDKSKNLRGKLLTKYDGAGVVTHESYDFKGNELRTVRNYTAKYNEQPNWNVIPSVALQPGDYVTVSKYDALSRSIEEHTPDGSITKSLFAESNLLNVVKVSIKGGTEKTFVKKIEHDAKGQREKVEYSQDGITNVAVINYIYDPFTYKVRKIRTVRTSDNAIMQDLNYTYDAAGNVTHVLDLSQQTLYFNNQQIDASNNYEFDALYRLVKSEGREHAGGNRPPDFSDLFRMQLPHKADGAAMQNYRQFYEYDHAGNMLKMIHNAGTGALTNRWAREFTYNTANADPLLRNNQLLSTTVGGVTENFTYDLQGNMKSISHLSSMKWDFEKRLRSIDLTGGGTVWYVYDGEGTRVRKVVERNDGFIEDRIYIGITEFYSIYKKDGAGNVTETQLQRETLHVLDGQSRIAVVDTRTAGDDGTDPQLIRFQFGNHLGTAVLELDHAGAIISYEEYYPFGSTSFQSGRSVAEVKLKRYRYTSKERDEESGLYYHGSRYYAPWLARWTSPDPLGVKGGINVYVYSDNSPVNTTDPTGLWPSWRTVAVVAAVVVVGVAVTVATAGAAGPVIAGVAAGALGTGTAAATVATGVAVGAVAGAAGGLAGGVAGELTRQSVNSKALGLGNEEFSGKKIAKAGAEGLVAGAVGGAVTGGLGAAAQVIRAGAAGASAAGTAATTTARTATTATTAARATTTARVAAASVRAVKGAATGAAGSAAGEAGRGLVFEGKIDTEKVKSAALVGGAVGAGVGIANITAPNRPISPKGYQAGLKIRGSVLGTTAKVTGKTYVIAHHGSVVFPGEPPRLVVSVATPRGTQAFYARTGAGGSNVGGAQPGQWAPFNGFAETPGVFAYEGQLYRATEGWLVKHPYSSGRTSADPLYRFGTQENLETSQWLGRQNLRVNPAERPYTEINPELKAAGVEVLDPAKRSQ